MKKELKSGWRGGTLLIKSPTLRFPGRQLPALHPSPILLRPFASYSSGGCCFPSVPSCLPGALPGSLVQGGLDTIWKRKKAPPVHMTCLEGEGKGGRVHAYKEPGGPDARWRCDTQLNLALALFCKCCREIQEYFQRWAMWP